MRNSIDAPAELKELKKAGVVPCSVTRVNMKLIVWDIDVNYAVTSLDVAIPAQDKRLQNCGAYVHYVVCCWYAYKNSQT